MITILMLTTIILLELSVIGGLLGPASLGHILFRRGDYEGAADWFKRAFAMSRIAPKRRVVLTSCICACYVHMGDYTQAQPYAENAIREAQKRGMRHALAVAQLYHSVILIRLGDFDRALSTLDSVLAEIGTNSSMRPLAELYHASALLNVGRLEDAAKRAETLRQNPKIDADVKTLAEYTVAECLYLAEKPADALGIIKKAMECKPKAAWVMPLLRAAHLKYLIETGRLMEAKEAEPKLLGIQTKQTPSIQAAILRASAMLALRSDDLDRARQRAGEACALDPNPNAQAEALLIQAEVFWARHNLHRAQSLCEDIQHLNAIAFYHNRAHLLLERITAPEVIPVEAAPSEQTSEDHTNEGDVEDDSAPRD